jgi:hypothetical protein
MKESRNRYEKDGKAQDQQAKPPTREDEGYHKKRGRGKQTKAEVQPVAIKAEPR